MLHELKDLALTMLQGIVEFGNDGLLLNTYTFRTVDNQVRRLYEKTIGGCISSGTISDSFSGSGC
jgi:hypothetical protein